MLSPSPASPTSPSLSPSPLLVRSRVIATHCMEMHGAAPISLLSLPCECVPE